MSDNNNKIKNIAILGSTGSIGKQTLDVCREYPGRLRPLVLVAGRKVDELAAQAALWRPKLAVIADVNLEGELRRLLEGTGVEVRSGDSAICEAMTLPEVDTVVTATVGYSGLAPTLAAIDAGKEIALANKETLVVAGELVTARLQAHQLQACQPQNLAPKNRQPLDCALNEVKGPTAFHSSHATSGAQSAPRLRILPVDSEHSAIYQCLVGEAPESVSKLIITASGGPFRTWTKEQIASATLRDALKHPNWSMGAKITIDSATMVNKAFEIIEARWLFGVQPNQIEAVVHPQSIVHSMVEFRDGSIKAQLGLPDMRGPIRYALAGASRPASDTPRLDFTQFSTLTFETPDTDRFPGLTLGRMALERGGLTPCVINAANEVAVAAFLKERIRYVDIVPLIMEAVATMPIDIVHPGYEDYVACNAETRIRTEEFIK